MKRNISDLLDSYPVEGLDLGITTPYSSSRIKELTMNKVSMNKPRKHIDMYPEFWTHKKLN